MEKMNIYGGSTAEPFKVEYNVPDCQGGWAVVKDGTGQVIGCHKTEADAKAHLDMMNAATTTDILGAEVRNTKSVDAISFWDGVFFPAQKGTMGPDFGAVEQDTGWASTYNSPPDKDGKPGTGYGNPR